MPDTVTSLYVLILLLPGFVGYLTFSAVHDRKVEDSFDKVAFVVLITALSTAILGWAAGLALPEAGEGISGKATQDFLLGLFPIQTLLCAVIGFLFGAVANSKWFSDLANKAGVSSKSGHAAVLVATIRAHPDCFLRFRFKGGGYVQGHPILYSLDGEECCIFVEKASYRRKRPDRRFKIPSQVDVDGPGILLLNFDDVQFVEVI